MCWHACVSLSIMCSMYRGCFENEFSGTRGLVAMTSAQHAEGRQFDPGRVYSYVSVCTVLIY